jgi:ABC-2 type transport system ATP-binding protein
MSENQPVVIDCRSLTKRYSAHMAVENLDWKVHQSTVTALLGKNGAGKTTTLGMIANLIRPTRGDAEIFGKPVTKLVSSDFTKLGFISESQALPEWMSIRYLLNYLKPMYPTWDDAFSTKLVDLFELPLDRKISQLSRGMRMKTAFVSSLAYRPELLLLDEPFSGLDTIVREDLIEALLDLTEQERWTIVISSHDIDDIERLIDHVAVINHGRLLLHEPIETIQDRFREISFLTNEKESSSLGETWLGYDRQGERITFVETAFDEGRTPMELRERFPDLRDLSINQMSLKT